MRVPKHLDQLTVFQFQECDVINNDASLDPLRKVDLLLSTVTGVDMAKLNKLPRKERSVYRHKVIDLFKTEPSKKPKRFILVKGRAYQAIQLASDLSDLMSTDQFTAHSEYTKENAIANMHLVLPLMYCRYRPFRKPAIEKNQTKLAEVFKQAKIGDVSGTAFFFKMQHEAFIPVLTEMRDKAMTVIADHLKEIQTSGMVSETNTVGTTH